MTPVFQASAAYRTAARASAMLLVLLTGCAQQAIDRAPPAPDQPWRATGQIWRTSPDAPPPEAVTREPRGFGIPTVPALTAASHVMAFDPQTPLGLAQLIDIAQRENAQTRAAWNRAREAALSVGLTEALFLPMISASVISGRQRINVPLPVSVGGTNPTIRNTVTGTLPLLTLNWLLFDFGERQALRDAAESVSLSANILFNATHQKVIRDVTDHFYQYDAARTRTRLARDALANHVKVRQAAQARLKAGVATQLDLALAQQAETQGKLHLIGSQGTERNTYLALLGAIGLPPDTALPVASPAHARLPTELAALTGQRMQDALSQRPDIAAAYAAMQAAEAGERAAQAAFLPKVFLSAALTRNHGSFEIGSLPALDQKASASGIWLGVTLPLYDGGMRATQVGKARIRREDAAEQLRSLQQTALREIAAAENILRTALQSHDAATGLVRTAQVAYDSALASYRQGLVTVTLTTEASTQLNKAHQALADARYAALAAAANLAFLMGDMVSPQADWLAPAPTHSPAPLAQ